MSQQESILVERALRWCDGPGGAARMGIEHGAWCVGCCWALMVVYFAVGVTSTDETSRQVWVMNADGTGKTQLTSTPNFSENPSWSPDAQRIVFDSDRVEKGNLELYSMKADGSDVRRLTNSPALDALPAFSPDGKKIVFVSDRLQKDSRRLFVISTGGGAAKRLIAGDEPNFQMVPDWQPLRLGVQEKPPVPPVPPLPAGGVADRVDPLYDRADAWAVQMTSGVTYRINLSPRKGCASIAVYRPGTRVFGIGGRVSYRACGGYLTFTPGPSGGGTYSLVVTAQPGTEAIVAYDLQAAPAGPDDQGPGILLADDQRVTGTLSGSGIDVVDLYRFDVDRPSTVRIALAAKPGHSLALTTVDGTAIEQAEAGATIRRTLKPGTYLTAVSATGRAGGSYALDLLVRAVTKTTLSADGKKKVTVPVGEPVVLQPTTAPAPDGGQVRLQLDYQDPLAGWVFRKTWTVSPGSSVTFAPPAVGTWRVRASYFGTNSYSPSRSELITIHAVTQVVGT